MNRQQELARLDRLATSSEGGLVAVYGRRRVGKTRLLLEWAGRHDSAYTVADLSVPELQRRYLAEAVAARLPGFADVDYPDWRTLFSRLAREAREHGWRGPLILDELPYLVLAAPELPSVLQRWVDHEAREAGLRVAVAGSSQRMMQGLVLSAEAPLYGRAKEILEIRPLAPRHLAEVFPTASPSRIVQLWAAWGGIPRYWELAQELGEVAAAAQIAQLVLDPLGPLHREPDRLLWEEVPSALETRPVLEAIGAGAHRVSEIAGRLGRPATSMARPLERLLGLGLVRREVPFGEPERGSKRALYKIDDPFTRLWFRLVAPYRAQLASGSAAVRERLLERAWPGLLGQAWEELVRSQLPWLPAEHSLGRLGPWSPGSRWWHGDRPEWDVVSADLDGTLVLVGEAKWSSDPLNQKAVDGHLQRLMARPLPPLPGPLQNARVIRVLFVPGVTQPVPRRRSADAPRVVTAAELLG